MLAATLLIFTPVAPLLQEEAAGAPSEQEGAVEETLDEKVAKDAAAIAAAFDVWAADKEHKLKEYRSDDGRILLISDFGGGVAKDALKRSTGMLERLDRALGAPAEGEEALLRAVMIQSPDAYRSLCGALGGASPPQVEYFMRAMDWTGFTIYKPELTVYFHDPQVQDEARADHNVGHNLAHLEVHRRYGVMPLWIAEAIATACEDGAWGEVWAPWNLHGFVWASSHAEWRGKRTREIAAWAVEEGFTHLWSYTADPYQEPLAKLAFALATYGLDRDPIGLAAFLDRLQAAYSVPDEYGVRKDPTPEQYEAFLAESFGEGFLEDFAEWWKKPPSWKKKPKFRERETLPEPLPEPEPVEPDPSEG